MKTYKREFSEKWRDAFGLMQIFVSETLSTLPEGVQVQVTLAKPLLAESSKQDRDDFNEWVGFLKTGPSQVTIAMAPDIQAHAIEICEPEEQP